MKNKITDLRNRLFETIDSLMDDEKPMDIDRADAIANVAQVVVNSAKVEVDFLRMQADSDNVGTGFIEALEPIDKPEPFKGSPALPRVVRGMAASGD